MAVIKVAILEDHRGIIDSYEQRLGTDPGIEIVGTAAFGEALEPLLRQHEVDVLLLDLELKCSAENNNPYPVLYTIPRLFERHPNLKILVISGHSRRTFVKAAMGAGAIGYILKDDWGAFENLATIVKLANAGSVYLSKEAHEHLLRDHTAANGLSKQELEALALCAAYPEKSLEELAKQVHISGSTMRSQLSAVYKKLGVKSRAAVVVEAKRRGVLL